MLKKECCKKHDDIKYRVAYLGYESYLYQCPVCKTVWEGY